MKGYRDALRFISILVFGLLLAIFIGGRLDAYFQTSPWIMLAGILYVIIGSLYILLKDAGGKHE